jgi:hypothetical protein
MKYKTKTLRPWQVKRACRWTLIGLIILIAILLFACTPLKKEKPFVIIGKSPNAPKCENLPGSDDNYCKYTYQGANGIAYSFCDYEDAYQIGDTIK